MNVHAFIIIVLVLWNISVMEFVLLQLCKVSFPCKFLVTIDETYDHCFLLPGRSIDQRAGVGRNEEEPIVLFYLFSTKLW